MALFAILTIPLCLYLLFRALAPAEDHSKNNSLLQSVLSSIGLLQNESQHAPARPLLLKRKEVEQLDSTTWGHQSYSAFRTAVTSESPVAFPCVYATKGFKAMEHRYLFLESDNMQDHTSPSAMTLSAALKAYLDTAPSDLGPNTSLVVLFPIPTSQESTSLSVMDYHQKYWTCLRALRRSDPKPWPAHIPTSTDSPLWRFCFNGQPLFSAALTPAHASRRSRYAPCFCIVFQPNFVFDILFATQLKKQSAIDKVRGLLARFDDVPISPELKNYGDPTGRESKQYFILDGNEEAVGCPWESLDD
ncbi:YqcI/YcgG family protein [Aspergillus mulundensis]|uniref:Uncharacterized protein n=1 Tax=Aspergillus mulundensis TaxID=1810919 RepID=A0A3D8S4J5_9EURO|nr:hypothetical protein DSM5745_04588 [Aspergillus mulundensis]RDW81031.1 hypothetical protein DSM5745_04588 [Aspergillus mulundensis]